MAFLGDFNIGFDEILILSPLVIFMAFWLWMLIDCARSSMDIGNKATWLAVILFSNFIGAAIYYYTIKTPRDTNRNNPPG